MADYYTTIVEHRKCEKSILTESIKDKLEVVSNFVQATKGFVDMVCRVGSIDGVPEEFYDHFRYEHTDEISSLLKNTKFVLEDDTYATLEFASTDLPLDLVGKWLHFLYKDSPDTFEHAIGYSITCSKLRPFTFSGGVLIVNNDGYRVLDAYKLYQFWDATRIASLDV